MDDARSGKGSDDGSMLPNKTPKTVREWAYVGDQLEYALRMALDKLRRTPVDEPCLFSMKMQVLQHVQLAIVGTYALIAHGRHHVEGSHVDKDPGSSESSRGMVGALEAMLASPELDGELFSTEFMTGGLDLDGLLRSLMEADDAEAVTRAKAIRRPIRPTPPAKGSTHD